MAVVLIVLSLYTVSAFTAAIASLLWVPRVPEATLAVRALRVGAIAGLFLLAFGTGCDNARTVAGLFAARYETRRGHAPRLRIPFRSTAVCAWSVCDVVWIPYVFQECVSF